MLAEVQPESSNSSSPSDIELANAIVAGDHDGFRILMRRHNRLLYRTARSIVKDDLDSEDAVQNAYLLAYRNMASFRHDSTLSTWLVRIVINEALACLRKRSRTPEAIRLDGPEFDDALESAAEKLGSRPERPDEALMRADTRRLVEAKIDELPLPYRAVFMLRGLEEFSVSETAAALDVPESTVRTRFFRARALLRNSLSVADGELKTAFAFAGERCDRIVMNVIFALTAGSRSSGDRPHLGLFQFRESERTFSSLGDG